MLAGLDPARSTAYRGAPPPHRSGGLSPLPLVVGGAVIALALLVLAVRIGRTRHHRRTAGT